MESLARENEKTAAIGNMPVNAKGDQIKGGKVTKTADQIARENHRVQSVVVNTGLKGRQPIAPDATIEQTKAVKVTKPAAPATVKKETELPSGDIIVEGDTDGN
jgi:hypothetical protein